MKQFHIFLNEGQTRNSNIRFRDLIIKNSGTWPFRSVTQGVDYKACLPKTAWPPTYEFGLHLK